ncbi:MAG: Phytochrome-like protein cph1 [Chloroflexi bacterium ADurb.Bin222]|nr:MAG: Phytochrome-like protein cph1 [Chloroflexi bacterium ADurb.Bin222]
MKESKMQEPASILIVDDSPENLQVLSNMLATVGYRVRAVTSGARALAAIEAAPPDLVLLDVMMPEMNGYQVCQRLKENAQTRDIPVIFISALSGMEEKLRAFSVGGVDYVAKPFQPQEIIARVETHVRSRRLQQQLEAANAELSRQLEAVNQLNAELQARNEELDAFAHTVAHDLRDPLNVLLGYAELLVTRTPLDTLCAQAAEGILRTATQMADIIQALLLLAGVRQQPSPALGPVEMDAVVKDALARLGPAIEKLQAEIVQPAAWPRVWSYAPWLEEVWVNYMDNALKHGGQPPRVELGVTPLPGGSLRFWVKDNGPGIPPEQQEQLFIPFQRLGSSRVAGYGLGLSIVRRIMERLGGETGVESQPKQGSTFFFTLPPSPEEAAP